MHVDSPVYVREPTGTHARTDEPTCADKVLHNSVIKSMGHTRILPIQSSGFALIWGAVYPFIVLFKILLPCWWECIIKENAGTGKDSGDKGKGKSTIDNHYVKDMLKWYYFEIFQLWRIYLNKKTICMKQKILYIHGLSSSGSSSTAKNLRMFCPNYEILSPDLPILPDEALDMLRSLCKKRASEYNHRHIHGRHVCRTAQRLSQNTGQPGFSRFRIHAHPDWCSWISKSPARRQNPVRNHIRIMWCLSSNRKMPILRTSHHLTKTIHTPCSERTTL